MQPVHHRPTNGYGKSTTTGGVGMSNNLPGVSMNYRPVKFESDMVYFKPRPIPSYQMVEETNANNQQMNHIQNPASMDYFIPGSPELYPNNGGNAMSPPPMKTCSCTYHEKPQDLQNMQHIDMMYKPEHEEATAQWTPNTNEMQHLYLRPPPPPSTMMSRPPPEMVPMYVIEDQVALAEQQNELGQGNHIDDNYSTHFMVTSADDNIGKDRLSYKPSMAMIPHGKRRHHLVPLHAAAVLAEGRRARKKANNNFTHKNVLYVPLMNKPQTANAASPRIDSSLNEIDNSSNEWKPFPKE